MSLMKNASTIIILLKWNLQGLKSVPFNLSNKIDPPKNYDYRVLFLKRSASLKLWPNFHVFPGGKVDEFDASPLWKSEGVIESGKEESGESLAFKISVLRETLEETNIFLDQNTEISERFPVDKIHAMKQKMHADRSGEAMFKFLKENNLKMSLNNLVPWGRWITPPINPKLPRFNTMFYIAPLSQFPLNVSIDDGESTAVDWLSPEEALDHYNNGLIKLSPPTWMTMVQMLNLHTLDKVIEMGHQREKHLDYQALYDPIIKFETTPEGKKKQVFCYHGDYQNPATPASSKDTEYKNRLVTTSSSNDLTKPTTWVYKFENTIPNHIDSSYHNHQANPKPSKL